MTQKTKAQLATDLAANLPNNSTGAITPAVMRTHLTDMSDSYVAETLVDAKGDIYVASAADTPARLAVGTDGQQLLADSSATSGLGWSARPDVALGPTGCLGQTLDRNHALVSAAVLTSGTLRMSGLYLPKGVTVTNISFMAATGLTNPTNWWFGLYDSALLGLRLTADQTTTAWGNNTSKTVALTSTFTTTYSGLYYVGIMVAAATPGTFFGVQPSNAGPTAVTAPPLTFQSVASLTTPPTAGQAGGVGGTATNTGVAGSYCYAWLT